MNLANSAKKGALPSMIASHRMLATWKAPHALPKRNASGRAESRAVGLDFRTEITARGNTFFSDMPADGGGSGKLPTPKASMPDDGSGRWGLRVFPYCSSRAC
jgi:hypothetical protein